MAEYNKTSRLTDMLSCASGAALLWVLLILTVFSILGSSLFFLMATEIRQSSRYNYWTQAYLYAYSGIEVAWKIIEEDVTRGAQERLLDNDNGVSDKLYIHGSLEDLSLEVGPYSGHFHAMEPDQRPSLVAVVSWESGSGQIESTGWYRGSERQLIRRFSWTPGSSGGGGLAGGGPPSTSDIKPVSGAGESFAEYSGDNPDYVHSSSTSLSPAFTTSNGHHIVPNINSQTTQTVLFRTDQGSGVLAPSGGGPGSGSDFQAPIMHFESPLSITGSFKLTLKAKLIVFHHQVTVTGGGANPSALCFDVYPGEDQGFVYFAEESSIRGTNYGPGLFRFTELICSPYGDGLQPDEIDEEANAGGDQGLIPGPFQ